MKEGDALVIVANKMDFLVKKDHAKEDSIRNVFYFFKKEPVVPEHSLNGDVVNAFVPIAHVARCRWKRKITNSLLNLWSCVNVLNSN